MPAALTISAHFLISAPTNAFSASEVLELRLDAGGEELLLDRAVGDGGDEAIRRAAALGKGSVAFQRRPRINRHDATT